MPKITLVDQEINNTHIIETVSIDDNGDLLLEGHDMGEAPKEFWGKSSYEHTATVKAKDKDWLLVKLLAAKFKSKLEITTYLKENNIPYKVFSW